MRLLLLCCALTVAIFGHSPPYRVEQKSKPDQDQSKSKTAEKSSPTPNTAIPSKPAEPTPNTEQSSPTKKPDECWLCKSSPTDWGLLIVTGIAVWVASRTLKVLVRQTKATETAAEAGRDNAIAAKQSADAAKISSDIARAALVTAERAFVNFTFDYSLLKLPRDDDSTVARAWDIRIKVANHGSTPTVNLRWCYNWRWLPGDLPEDYGFPDAASVQHHPLRIMPRAHIFTGAMEIPKDVMDRVRQKECRLYFYGWAEYNDAFEGTPAHRTNFCHEGTVVETEKGPVLSIRSYPRHNEAT